MKTTQEDIRQGDSDYAAAYEEEGAAPVEQTDDEAFGIEPAAEGQTEDAPHGEMPVGEAEVDAGDVPGDRPAEPTTADEETPAEAEGDDLDAAAGEPRDDTGAVTESVEPGSMTPEDIAKERQRLKSWEGRLKAEEARRKAAEPAAATPDEPMGDAGGDEPPAMDAGGEGMAANPEEAEAVSEVVEKVESGELTPEQAMARLSEDFGPDFVKMIELIAGASAGKAAGEAVDSRVGELKGAVDEIISHIEDSSTRAHYKEIAAAHPDFREIGASEGFKLYIESLPETEQAAAKATANGGSADEIVAMLNAYKASAENKEPEADAPAADPVIDQETDSAMDAAEGVRSTGMRLPESPKPAADSYEDAWEDA